GCCGVGAERCVVRRCAVELFEQHTSGDVAADGRAWLGTCVPAGSPPLGGGQQPAVVQLPAPLVVDRHVVGVEVVDQQGQPGGDVRPVPGGAQQLHGLGDVVPGGGRAEEPGGVGQLQPVDGQVTTALGPRGVVISGCSAPAAWWTSA